MELPRKKQTKDVQQRVESKLADIELQPGASLWQAPLFNLRGKHLLAKNDFKNAVKYFNLALEAGKERSYGPLIGEVARDAFATVLQIQKLNPNNHERYLRDMMANGGLENIAYGIIPNLQDVALLISDYFWTDLYKPYPGFTPLSSSKPFGE